MLHAAALGWQALVHISPILLSPKQPLARAQSSYSDSCSAEAPGLLQQVWAWHVATSRIIQTHITLLGLTLSQMSHGQSWMLGQD